MQQIVIAVKTPIQTLQQYSDDSGLSLNQVKERISSGLIPFIKDGERGKLVNVAKLAYQLLNTEKSDKTH